MLTVEMKGLDKLLKGLKQEKERVEKALNTAIKIEGYRLRKEMQKEIRAGAPGGRPFAPLSAIVKRRYGNRRSGPLARLAVAVRYQVTQRDPMEMHVGWVGPRVSKSWKYIARVQQEGFSFPVNPELRRALRRRGARLPKRSPYREYFFLRKETRRFRVPARPIIEPFWRAHEQEAWRNIKNNWKRKMRGGEDLMVDHRLEIVLAAKNASSKAFRQVNESIKSLTKNVFSLRGAMTGLLGGAAMYKLAGAIKQWERLAGIQEQAEAGVRQGM